MTITIDPEEYAKHVATVQTTPSVFATNIMPSASTKVIRTSARWPGLMRLSTLAEYLDMSVSAVSKLVRNGHLPPPTTEPTPRQKRWSRDIIDAHFQQKQEAKLTGPSVDDLIARSFATNQGGR